MVGLRQADPFTLVVFHRIVGADRFPPTRDQAPVGVEKLLPASLILPVLQPPNQAPPCLREEVARHVFSFGVARRPDKYISGLAKGGCQ